MARATNRAKAKVWSGPTTSDMDGPIWGVAVSMFGYIRSQEERDKAFAKISAEHERLKAKEAETVE